MQAHGIASLFISHKLNEVIDVADRVTVLRDGRTVGTLPREELSNQAGRLMTGRRLTQTPFSYAGEPRKKLLEVRGLTKQHNFADISFDLYEGEILGVAGLTAPAVRNWRSRSSASAWPIAAHHCDGR